MSLTSTKKKDKNIVEMEISVSAKELADAADIVYKRKAKSIAVPGFRKGKAPRKIIEKMYGEGVFLEDAMNDIYPKAYTAAVEEAGIEPVDQADVEVISVDKEAGVVFKATVTVKPEVTVKDYKGIKAEKTIATVTDEQVDGEIESMRERGARILSVDNRPAEMGDETIIDFEGFIDGVAFPGGKGEKFSLALGSGSFIGNFEEQIAGHSVGDEFDVNVTFPEEYHAAELAGKPALFKVKLHEIKGKELPELDDEFAKDVSEFDTLDELKADIRAKMTERAEKTAQDDLENALIDKVIEGLEADIPECMFKNRIDEMVRDFEYRLQSQGMNLQTYLQYTGMDMESFRKTFREQSERQVKIRLALEKIAELENIQPTAEEIEAEFAKMAEAHNVDVKKVKAFVKEREIAGDLRTNKAIDIVRDSAQVTEKVAEKKEKPAKKEPVKKETMKKEPAAKKEDGDPPPAKKKTTKKSDAEE